MFPVEIDEAAESSQSPGTEMAKVDTVVTESANSQLQASNDMSLTPIAHKIFHDKMFSENLLNRLNQMRKSSAEPWCDVTLKCRGDKDIRAHGCVLANQCELDPTCKEIEVDLDYKSVASIVDFCYTGKLAMNIDNIVDLLKAAESLKLNTGVSEAMEKYLVKNLRLMATRKELIIQLNPETIRRALADTEREKKLPIWCLLLFTWWEHDPTNRSDAYREFMQEFNMNDVDVCMGTRNPVNFCFGSPPVLTDTWGDPPSPDESPSTRTGQNSDLSTERNNVTAVLGAAPSTTSELPPSLLSPFSFGSNVSNSDRAATTPAVGFVRRVASSKGRRNNLF